MTYTKLLDHNFNENQFQMLSIGNSDFDCNIKEALLIKSEKPTLAIVSEWLNIYSLCI